MKRAASLDVSERKDFQILHYIYFSFKTSQKGHANDVYYRVINVNTSPLTG